MTRSDPRTLRFRVTRALVASSAMLVAAASCDDSDSGAVDETTSGGSDEGELASDTIIVNPGPQPDVGSSRDEEDAELRAREPLPIVNPAPVDARR